jgi:hypothetical protein
MAQATLESLKQAMLFLEDVQDISEVLDADVEDMEEHQQVCALAAVLHSILKCGMGFGKSV